MFADIAKPLSSLVQLCPVLTTNLTENVQVVKYRRKFLLWGGGNLDAKSAMSFSIKDTIKALAHFFTKTRLARLSLLGYFSLY